MSEKPDESGPDDVAASARSVAPGPDVIAALAGLDPKALSDAGRIDAIVAAESALAWLTSVQNSLLASLSRQPGPTPEDKKWESLEVSCALGVSALAAVDRLTLARNLVGGRLAPAGELMARGQLSPWRARALADELAQCDDATAAAVQAEVLPESGGLTSGQFRKAVHRSVLTHAAPVEQEQRARAVADRCVRLTRPDRYGMTGLWALLPAEGAAAVMHALNHGADLCNPTDPRTLDQRRADALIALATNGGGIPAGTSGGVKPSVNVTVALSTLLGFDEQAGELNGEPIPATLARQLASDDTGTWRRLLTDQRGVLIDYGRTKYRPPTALAEFVAARDQVCTFPTCNRKASSCDIDHETARADGGTTNEPNLAIVSPRHHHAKHEAGWTKKRQPDGSTQWTSPTGHKYRKPPATYPIDHTGRPDPGDDPPPF